MHLIHLFLAVYPATYALHASVNIAIIAIQPITHHVYNKYIKIWFSLALTIQCL